MTHGLLSLGRAFPSVANVFVTMQDGRPVSATSALLAALVAPHARNDTTDSAYLDLARVTRELAGASNVNRDYDAYLKTALTVLPVLAWTEIGYVAAAIWNAARIAN